VVPRFSLIVTAMILAAGLIISTWIASGALVRSRGTETITVKGYAEQPIISDLGTWFGVYSVDATDLVSGYAALQDDTVSVRGYLESLGASPQSLRLSAVTTHTLYHRDANGRETNKVDRYRLMRTVSVESTDLALLQRLAARATELIQEGVNFESSAPAYFYTKLEERKMKMLGEAMSNATERARTLATSSGASVGRLVRASQGVFQITPPYSTEVSDSGYNDTSTIDKVIKAVVTAEFAID
jgi:hypothetical protein